MQNDIIEIEGIFFVSKEFSPSQIPRSLKHTYTNPHLTDQPTNQPISSTSTNSSLASLELVTSARSSCDQQVAEVEFLVTMVTVPKQSVDEIGRYTCDL